MTESKPAEMPWIIPYLIVSDADKACEFYQTLFGFEIVGEPMRDEEGRLRHAELRYETGMIMVGREGEYEGVNWQSPKTQGIATSPVGLYVYCHDVDDLYERAEASSAKRVQEPTDMFWGDRMCRIEDVDGHSWSFATKIADSVPSSVSNV